MAEPVTDKVHVRIAPPGEWANIINEMSRDFTSVREIRIRHGEPITEAGATSAIMMFGKSDVGQPRLTPEDCDILSDILLGIKPEALCQT